MVTIENPSKYMLYIYGEYTALSVLDSLKDAGSIQIAMSDNSYFGESMRLEKDAVLVLRDHLTALLEELATGKLDEEREDELPACYCQGEPCGDTYDNCHYGQLPPDEEREGTHD